jgi:hypothetical protein
MMKSFKEKEGAEKFKLHEMFYNTTSSFVAGIIAAAVTNPLECVTVNKQTVEGF